MKKRFCKFCGMPISHGSKNGTCTKCKHRASNQYSSGKKCSKCGKPIVNWNKSGICRICSHWNIQDPYRKQRAVEYTGVIGVCWKCGREFALQSNQYKCYERHGMHWCPECRQGEDYKDFEYQERVNQSMSALRNNFTVNWFGE